MALLLADGFEQYTSLNDLYSTVYTSGSSMIGRWAGAVNSLGTLSTTTFRTTQPGGTSKSMLLNANHSQAVYIPPNTNLYVGFAINTSVLGWWPFGLSTQWNVPNAFTAGIRLAFNSDGSISVNTPTLGNIVASPATTVNVNTWYYIELNVVYGTTGSVTLKVDGNTVASASSVNTTGGIAASGWNYLHFGGPGGANAFYDDVYICDSTGTNHNNFLGPINVQTLFPSSAGASSDMTPTGAASNWDCVNETTSDGDTTYISASAANLTDRYNVQSILGSPSSVAAVIVGNFSKKIDNGPRLLRNVLTNGTGTVEGVSTMPQNGWYKYSLDVFPTQPDTSAWTVPALTGLQIGVKSQ